MALQCPSLHPARQCSVHVRQVVDRAAEGDAVALASGGGYQCGVTVNKSLSFYTVGGGYATFDCRETHRAFWFLDVSVNVTGIDVRHGKAPDGAGGGGVLVQQTTLRRSLVHFSDCLWEANEAPNSRGGGVFVSFSGGSGGALSFVACSWKRNIAAGGGGTFVHYGENTNAASVLFSKCSWDSNIAFDVRGEEEGLGGGVFMEFDRNARGAGVSFSACAWTNNTSAAAFGGGMYLKFDDDASAANVSVSQSTFANNAASEGGGAYLQFSRGAQGPTLSFLTSVWLNNTAGSAGGVYVGLGIDVTAATVTFHSCDWVNNTAQYIGGGTSIASGGAAASSFSFSSCVWYNNVAVQGGGANVDFFRKAYVTALRFIDCIWTGNEGVGGGAYVHFYSEAAATSILFTACTWTNHMKGGLCLHNTGPTEATNISFNLCSWNSNRNGNHGGGALVSFGDGARGASLSFSACTWFNNSALPAQGGGVHVRFGASNSSSVALVGCVFMNNSATDGGALYAWLPSRPADLERIDGTSFVAVWTTQVRIVVASCQFVQNVAAGSASQGGAAFVHGGDLLALRSVSFWGNVAAFMGGALRVAGNVTLDVVGSSFANNTALQGGQVYADTLSNVNMVNSSVALQPGGTWWVRQAQTMLSLGSSQTCPPGHVLTNIYVSWSEATAGDRSFRRSTQLADCQPCPQGRYSRDVAALDDFGAIRQVACSACPYGGNCSRGGANIAGLPGFFGLNFTNYGVLFVGCPQGYCKPSMHEWNDSCAENRGGLLCGGCAQGFSQAVGSELCVLDKDCNAIWWMLPAAFALALCWLVVVSHHANDDGVLEIVFYFFNGAALVLPKPVMAPLVSLFRLRIEWRTPALCPVAGLTTFASLFWGYLSLPLLLIAALLAGRCLGKKRRQRAFVQLAMFSYSSYSDATFALFHCVRIGDLTGRYLYRSATTSCTTIWQIPMLALLGIVLLVPLVFFWFTCTCRRAPNEPLLVASGESMSLMDFLTSSFRNERRWWSGVLLVQLLVLNVVSVFVPDQSLKALLLTAATSIFLVLHMVARPHKKRRELLLQVLSLWCWIILAALSQPVADQMTLAAGDVDRLPDVDLGYKAFLLAPLTAALLLWLCAWLRRASTAASPSRQYSRSRWENDNYF